MIKFVLVIALLKERNIWKLDKESKKCKEKERLKISQRERLRILQSLSGGTELCHMNPFDIEKDGDLV